MRKLPRASPQDHREEEWHVAFTHKAHFDNCGIGRKKENLRTKNSISFDRNFVFSLSRYTFPWPDRKPTHRIPGSGIDFLVTSNWKNRDPEYGGDRDFQFSIPIQYEEAIIFAKAMLKMAKAIKNELEHGVGWKLSTEKKPLMEQRESGLYTLTVKK